MGPDADSLAVTEYHILSTTAEFFRIRSIIVSCNKTWHRRVAIDVSRQQKSEFFTRGEIAELPTLCRAFIV
jgi:hypothetical protein